MSSALPPGITLMEASAGTGKTFQIAQILLRLVVEEGLPIERILAVTFTEAATAELRDRVRRRLRDCLRGLRDPDWSAPDAPLADFLGTIADPDVAEARLHRALIDFDLAPIFTIHGFCSRMLTQHAFESGAAFDASLSADVEDLRERLVTDFTLRQVHDAHPSILAALEAGGITTEAMRDLARKAADPDRRVEPPHVEAPLPPLDTWLAVLADLQAAWAREGKTAAHTLATHEAFWQRRSVADGIEHAYPYKGTDDAAWRLGKWLERPGLLAPIPDGVTWFGRTHFDGATKPDATPPHLDLIDAVEAVLTEHAALSPPLRAWVLHLRHQLIAEVRHWIPLWSREQNLRTYDDLLIDLDKALQTRPEALVDHIRDAYDAALIDEFQDTDPVQWRIFQTLFSQRLCLIGDPKQAIYGFRGADVHTYHEAASQVPPERRVPLTENHRSDPRLIRALNRLFLRIEDCPLGAPDPPYEEIQPAIRHARLLVPTDDGWAADPRPPLHIRMISRYGGLIRQTRGMLNMNDLRAKLPALVADDIARELQRGGALWQPDGAPIPVTPGACAVLTRSNADARSMQLALRSRGIPSVLRATTSVFDSDTAADLRRVLGGILSPTDAGEVKRALTASLMGRTADAIADLQASQRAWSLEIGRFRRWHALWVDEGFYAMFRAWMDDDGVAARLLGESDGDRIVTDLLHLGELLHEASTVERLGPAGLMEWYADKGPTVDSDATGIRLESDADAVQVFTVHSAKGLEFPLVWVPYGWWGGFVGAQDKLHLEVYDREAQQWVLDIGFGPERQARIAAKEQETLEEDLRLLYVSLTRARHRVTVYHAVAGGLRSPLTWVLFRDDTESDVDTPGATAWAVARDEGEMKRRLNILTQHPDIGWDKLDVHADPERWQHESPVGDLSVRALTRNNPVDRWWRRTSFSGLSRHDQPQHGEDPPPAADKDDASEPEPPPRPGDPILLADLVGGAHVGNAIHTALELHDFQDPDALHDIVAAQLPAHGIEEQWTQPVTDNLLEMLQTPTGFGFCMADVPLDKRLVELEFTLPLAGGFDATSEVMTVSDLASAFDGEVAERMRRLRFTPVRGFLTGFIDLAFEHDGKWYVLDWKSNKLGRVHTDYARPHIDAKMHEANYVLQYHLYVVALHRYLGWRLGSAWDYERDFGGVLYLFTRGMSPRWGADFGVFRDVPSRERLDRLDVVLREGQP